VKDRTALLIAGSAGAASVKNTSRKAAGKGAASEKTMTGKAPEKKSARRVRREPAGKETAQATD